MSTARVWSLDSGIPDQVCDVRKLVAAAIGRRGRTDEQRFAAELLIGEVLQTVISRNHQATAIELQPGLAGWKLHIYAHAAPSAEEGLDEFRSALSSKCEVPFVVERSSQGVHICLTLPKTAGGLSSADRLWRMACCVIAERARRIVAFTGPRR